MYPINEPKCSRLRPEHGSAWRTVSCCVRCTTAGWMTRRWRWRWCTPTCPGCCSSTSWSSPQQSGRGRTRGCGEGGSMPVWSLGHYQVYQLAAPLHPVAQPTDCSGGVQHPLDWTGACSAVVVCTVHFVIQLDLREEAKNLNKFRENFKNSKDIIFPEPLAGFCKRYNRENKPDKAKSSSLICTIFNRPGVALAVLQTPSSLLH